MVGALPPSAEEKLRSLAGNDTIRQAIIGLSVLTNFLYVILSAAFYFTLKSINHLVTLTGAAFINLFVLLENAVSWTNHGALLMLSKGYISATSESQRSMYISAATYASSVLESPLASVWAIGTVAFGILLIGVVMLKSEFGRFTTYVGIAAGFLGIISVAGVDTAVIPHVLLTTVWLFFAGTKLYRMSFTSAV
jgi:hypothetical protein